MIVARLCFTQCGRGNGDADLGGGAFGAFGELGTLRSNL